MNPRPPIAFTDWVDQVGVQELAAKLRVNERTVRYWRLGMHKPRPEQMVKIVALSKGEVSLVSIFAMKRKYRPKKAVRR